MNDREEIWIVLMKKIFFWEIEIKIDVVKKYSLGIFSRVFLVVCWGKWEKREKGIKEYILFLKKV